jgi:hypothetical protein
MQAPGCNFLAQGFALNAYFSFSSCYAIIEYTNAILYLIPSKQPK